MKVITEKKTKKEVLKKIDKLVEKYTHPSIYSFFAIQGEIIMDLSNLYFDICNIEEEENTNTEFIETKFWKE